MRNPTDAEEKKRVKRTAWLFTPHRRIEDSREAWWLARQLAALTFEQLRRHLERDLEELGLNPIGRRVCLQNLNEAPPPKDPRFWKVLDQAKAVTKKHPDSVDYRFDKWIERYFSSPDGFAKEYGEPAPSDWIWAAVLIWLLLDWLREEGCETVKGQSNWYRGLWDQKEKEQALVTFGASPSQTELC